MIIHNDASYLVLRIFSRSYLITNHKDQKPKHFIVNEIGKINEGHKILVNQDQAYIVENNSINPVNVEVTLAKKLTRKIDILKFKRRKRYSKRMGYKQHYGYFYISKISQDPIT